MFNQSVANRNQSPGPPLIDPGEPTDSEHAKQAPVPESPYRPYADESALSELPYKPYDEQPVLDEVPYEPYKDI
jgi:hypothetical protein